MVMDSLIMKMTAMRCQVHQQMTALVASTLITMVILTQILHGYPIQMVRQTPSKTRQLNGMILTAMDLEMSWMALKETIA